MIRFLTSDGMTRAIFKMLGLTVVFGFKWAACLSFGYYLVMWLLRHDSDID